MSDGCKHGLYGPCLSCFKEVMELKDSEISELKDQVLSNDAILLSKNQELASVTQERDREIKRARTLEKELKDLSKSANVTELKKCGREITELKDEIKRLEEAFRVYQKAK